MAEKTGPYVDATEQLVTEIFVRDIAVSKEFYMRLGFKLQADRGSFVSLTWEGHRLFLDARENMPPPLGFPQANMRVLVPNVDDYWELVTKMGAKVFRLIEDRDYGVRDFTVLDPDGFGVRIGTRLNQRNVRHWLLPRNLRDPPDGFDLYEQIRNG